MSLHSTHCGKKIQKNCRSDVIIQSVENIENIENVESIENIESIESIGIIIGSIGNTASRWEENNILPTTPLPLYI